MGENGEDHNLILYFQRDVFAHHNLKEFVNTIPHYSFGFDVDITIISLNKFLEKCRRYEDVEHLHATEGFEKLQSCNGQ